ncbi:MAG: hypothetical protein KF908_03965 [Nitrosomonas sp.]|nr:hypothetical protein [Nitrosomonas sp.]MCW5608833.1 hypothetical protein [Nitrosomonas sp.]
MGQAKAIRKQHNQIVEQFLLTMKKVASMMYSAEKYVDNHRNIPLSFPFFGVFRKNKMFSIAA